MSINLPAVEFYSFIALAAWVVYYQWRSTNRKEDGGSHIDGAKAASPSRGEGPPDA